VIPLRSEGNLTPIVLAAKKKNNTSASMEANASTEAWPSAAHALVTTTNGHDTNNREDNSEDTSVDDLADGEC